MQARERYLLQGPAALGATELLALVLGHGDARQTAQQTALAVLDHFGDLQGVLDAPAQELTCVPGIGMARAVRVHAALQLGARARQVEPRCSPPIDSPEAAALWLRPWMLGLGVEELHALYLDRGSHVIFRASISRGSRSHTIVDPTEVFRPAVRCRASGVVVAHNHPSGNPEPSQSDLAVTQRLVSCGQVLGIPLLDHLVLAGARHVSLAERGHITTWASPPPATS